VVSRGRVDVTVDFTQTKPVEYEINRAMVAGYVTALRQMREEYGLEGGPDLATIARLPNVLIALPVVWARRLDRESSRH
jgi:uncharacterized protein YicC (UPF0701 family)